MNLQLADITREPRHEQAAAWFMALHDEEVADDVIQGWQQWMLSEANRKAYDEAERLWHRAGDLAPMPLPTPETPSLCVYDGSVSVRAFMQARRIQPPSESSIQAERSSQGVSDRKFHYAMAAVFATIGVAVLIVLSSLRHSDPQPGGMSVFETAVGQHQEILLPDGSRVQLGARSSVTTNVNSTERTVVLDRGVAAFKVSHDPDRPFRVLAGGGTITAVGTAFNVRRLEGVVVVTVTEGIVRVEPAGGGVASALRFRSGEVSRGQEISYGGAGNPSVLRDVDADAAMSWRDGRLQYRSEPLQQVVQDVNRYSVRSVAVADAAAGDVLYSGTVFERDIDDWLAALDKVFPQVQVVHSDDQHVIIRSRTADPRR